MTMKRIDNVGSHSLDIVVPAELVPATAGSGEG